MSYLKLEVKGLKDQLGKYAREEIKEEGQYERLVNGEKYAYEGLLKMLKKEPTQVRFTMLDRVQETVGNYGSERIEFLKDAFRKI